MGFLIPALHFSINYLKISQNIANPILQLRGTFKFCLLLNAKELGKFWNLVLKIPTAIKYTVEKSVAMGP